MEKKQAKSKQKLTCPVCHICGYSLDEMERVKCANRERLLQLAIRGLEEKIIRDCKAFGEDEFNIYWTMKCLENDILERRKLMQELKKYKKSRLNNFRGLL